MRHQEASGTFKPAAIVVLAGALGTAIAVSVVTLTTFSQRAEATPVYAQQTGKACGACHVNPAGGGTLTSAGEAFQKSNKK